MLAAKIQATGLPLASGARGDHATARTHLQEATGLAEQMPVEVGRWAGLWFGATNVGIRSTSLAVELGEHGQAVAAASTVHPELLPGTSRQAGVLGRLR